MNFNQLQYWPGLLLGFIAFLLVVITMEKRFFKVIKTYWFYNRSFFSVSSTVLMLAGMGGLLLSLLDLRGPEEKIKTEVPSERTIILIDTSASMLAEDVKPSRLQKAALIAKHFARKTVGQQISIVAFAEIQKKIVPFTNDLDLIDSRLDSIKNLRNHYGSSALSAAVQESIQYFKETGGEASGNILVLTDGEETANDVKFDIPKEVHVAFIGIGTTQGGRIPLDDPQGFRFGYKKDKGREIITKLNEDFFKAATADIGSAKYWIANSYSLPSDEVVNFFKSEKMKGDEQQDMVIKPVLMEWIVVPSLLLLVLAYGLKAIRVFTLGMIIVLMPLHAQEEKEIKLSPEIIQKLEMLRNGDLNKLEKLKLADDLYKSGSKDESLALYKENLDLKKIDKTIPPEAYLNYGTGLLEKGDARSGLEMYDNLDKSLGQDENSKNLKDMINKNVASFFKVVESKQQQKKDKKDQKEDQKENQQKDSGQNQNNNQNQSGQKQDKQQKPGEKSEDQKNEDQKGDQENKEQQDKDDKKEDEDKKDEKSSEGQEQKPMPPKKLPAKLKQLMSDDRQLQMKLIENGTRDLNKRKSRENKDW